MSDEALPWLRLGGGGGGEGRSRRRLGFGVDEKMSCGVVVEEWAKIKPPESGPRPGLDAWVTWLYGLHFALSSRAILGLHDATLG